MNVTGADEAADTLIDAATQMNAAPPPPPLPTATAAPPPPPAPPAEVDAGADPESPLGKRIRQYIMVRDKITEVKKAQEEALKPFQAAKESLEAVLSAMLAESGSDSQKVRGVGTVYRTTDASATISDGEAFRRFVLDEKAWSLIDWRANKTGVKEFMAQHKTVPPGVNYTQVQKIGVRRDSAAGN